MNELERRAAEYRKELEQLEHEPESRLERMKMLVAEEMCKYMEAHEMTRAALAERLGTSRAYVTKMLRGNCNFTLESLDRTAAALGCRLSVQFCPEGLKAARLLVNYEKRSVADKFDETAGMRNVSCIGADQTIIEEEYDESANAA